MSVNEFVLLIFVVIFFHFLKIITPCERIFRILGDVKNVNKQNKTKFLKKTVKGKRWNSSQRHERRLTNQWIPTDWRPTDSAIGGDRDGFWLGERFTPIRSLRPLGLRRESHIQDSSDLSATAGWPVVFPAISLPPVMFLRKLRGNLFLVQTASSVVFSRYIREKKFANVPYFGFFTTWYIAEIYIYNTVWN